MNYTKEILDKVKNYGLLQYDAEKVIKLIRPEDPEQFLEDLNNDDSVLGFIYNEGLNSGKYKIDVINLKLMSAEAEMKGLEVKRAKDVDKLVSEYLGENLNEEVEA